jgi:hypothetical protein
VFIAAAIENAVVIARATRDIVPLGFTHRLLQRLLQAEIDIAAS